MLLLLPLRDCPTGHTLNAERGECEDINECESDEATCDIDTQVCFNTVGSYKCLDILTDERQSSVGSAASSSRAHDCDTGLRYNTKTDECDGMLAGWLKGHGEWVSCFTLADQGLGRIVLVLSSISLNTLNIKRFKHSPASVNALWLCTCVSLFNSLLHFRSIFIPKRRGLG